MIGEKRLVERRSCSSMRRGDDVDHFAGLCRRIEELKAQLAARDRFLSNAAQELRNPMHAVAMQVQTVQMMAQMGDDRAIADRLFETNRSLQWFLRRTTALLDVSRIAAGLHSLELEAVDLREVLRHVEDLYQPQARLGETSLHIVCEGSLVGCWDGPALEQAIGNLVSNAIKFGAGTPVMLEADDPGTGTVNVRVSDHGGGISEADQQRMTDGFDQVVLHTDQRNGGFGVGLWMAWNLVNAHGGRIDVATSPSSGSTFAMSLPTTPSTGQRRAQGLGSENGT